MRISALIDSTIAHIILFLPFALIATASLNPIPSTSLLALPNHSPSAPTAAPAIPNFDQHAHQLNKRHYYLCEGTTRTWQGEWYAASFYTANGAAASYDAAAATGAVQPPVEVLGQARECEAYRSAWEAYTRSLGPGGAGSGVITGGSTAGGQGGRATTGGGVVLTTQDGTPVFTQVQSTATVAGGITSGILTPSGQPSGPSVTGAVTSGPSGSSATKSASTGTSSSDDSQSLSSTSSSTPSSAAPTSSAGAGGTETGQNAGSPTSTNDDINTCAGKMDYQAWASVASAVWAILIGGIIWAIWAMLRGKVGDVYSPVKGASVDGPPPRFNILTLLSPFTLPSSAPILAIPAAALHLGAITGLVSLAGALPLYIANVPCLGTTSPRNALGGRLGTLTDLSLLRLLNALDPSPESPSRSESISAAANLASSRMSLLHSVHSGPARRALSDTIAPAISSAHVRLIIVLVLIGLITLLGGLWLVLRVYRRMESQRRKMNEEAQWVDVVVLSKEEVPGWTGGEARLRERLVAAIKGTEDQDIGTRGEDAGQGEQDAAGQGEVDVQGVFAIPDTTALKKHVQERSALLVELERAEAADLAGKVFQPRLQLDTAHSDLPSPFADPARSQNRAPSPASSHITNPASLASLTSNNLLDRLRRSISPARSHTKPSAQRSGNASPDKSRFHEINRNSLALSGNGHGSGNGQSARFEIGQRIRIDEQGRYVPVTGSSEDAHGEEGPTPSDETTPSTASHLAGPSTSGQLGLVHEASTTRSAVPSALRPPSGITASSRSHIGSDPREGAGSTASTAHIVRPTPPHLIALRNRLRHANEAVIREQRAAMQRAIAGEGVVGWTVVGRGLRWLHRGKVLEGRTLQDARWSDLGKAVGAKTFVAKVAALAVVMSAMFIPVIGLTLASAPGFAYRLPFLRNLGRSNGLGSGIVQGLVPALIMTMLVVTGVWAIQRFASGLNTVSAVARDQLTYKATFWYLLTLCVVWALLVSSLEFAVQAFNLNIQEARFVADGAVFASWWVFILLVNLCIVVPGLYILQPIRLFRVWRAKRRGDFCRANAIELTPTYLLAPSLIGTFYILALSVLFPLLSIPCIILLYLSLVAVRYLSTFVCLPPTPTNAQYYNAELGMWTIRRIGWCLAIQPILFGLISLSRREWVIGAVSLGVAGAILVLIELTIGRKEHKRRTASGALSGEARGRLYRLEKTMTAGGVSTEETIQHRQEHMRQPSNSSLLLRISELLPGYSRLPPECPVPFENARLDDEYRTQLAARTSPPPDSRPAVAVGSKRNESHQEGTGEKRVKVRTSESDGLFHDPTRANKGLVYPPELLLPGVVVWLPRVSGADRRAAELEEGYGLPTVLDGSEVDGGRGAA